MKARLACALLVAACSPSRQAPSRTPSAAQPATQPATPPATATQPPAPAPAWETIELPSEDGVTITADLYRGDPDPSAPFFVLFHQAGSSRGEYREIGPRLADANVNALAIDQRAGGESAGVVNETHRRAVAAGKPTTYLDALPDMRAALAYAREHYARGPLLAWGSSYSASLVLVLAADQSSPIDAALAFSPGEYFEDLGKPADWVTRAAARLRKPVFMSSARSEAEHWQPMFRAVPAHTKARFIPETEGRHGSSALWPRYDDSDAYWDATAAFLLAYFEASGIATE